MNDNRIEVIKNEAKPLHGPADFDSLLHKADKTQYVLLGESSHGTSEFYKIRAELSKD